MAILIHNARVLTLAGGARPRRGRDLSELSAIEGASVLIEGERIARVGAGVLAGASAVAEGDRIDARGRVLMPAFVDCHTHACWAGERLDEWELKRRGAGYLEILRAGGGIMSTVRAVRSATEEELRDRLLDRLQWMAREGTMTVEVKSGYGLTTGDELKMLHAIQGAAQRWRGTIVATACIGHAIDPDVPGFVARTIDETLPAVHAEFPGVAIDAYCEEGAWSLEECLRLFDRAQDLGHPIRVHADQFHSLGLIPAAIERGFRSVDHLEATESDGLRRLGGSDVFGVMLPCSGFHLDGRYADGRCLVDAGGLLAIATNCNPGSAPTSSMPMAVALAVRNLGLTSAEAIAACTVNAAAVLGFDDRGTVEPGARADLVLLRWKDERQLGYEFGGNPVDAVISAGVLR